MEGLHAACLDSKGACSGCIRRLQGALVDADGEAVAEAGGEELAEFREDLRFAALARPSSDFGWAAAASLIFYTAFTEPRQVRQFTLSYSTPSPSFLLK